MFKSKYLSEADIEKINNKYKEGTTRAIALATSRRDRLEKRIERYRSGKIKFDGIEEDIISEINEMGPEEVSSLSFEDFCQLQMYTNPGRYSGVREEEIRSIQKKDYDNTIAMYKDSIRHLEAKHAQDYYFMFNKMTDEQIQGYLKYYYEREIHEILEGLFIRAIKTTIRESDKETYIMDNDGIRYATYEYANYTIELGKIGNIERIETLNEKQQEFRKRIRSAIDSVLMHPLSPLGGWAGMLVGLIIDHFTKFFIVDSLGINTLYGLFIGVAAAYTILGVKEYNSLMRDPRAIAEAQKLGLYEFIMKAEESKEKFKEFQDKMKEEYGANEEMLEEGRHVSGGL